MKMSRLNSQNSVFERAISFAVLLLLVDYESVLAVVYSFVTPLLLHKRLTPFWRKVLLEEKSDRLHGIFNSIDVG